MTSLRNEKYELEVALTQIQRFKDNKESEIRNILKQDICPECHSILADTTDLRSKRYNSIEDSTYIGDSIYEDLERTKHKIKLAEVDYIELSKRMESYKKDINLTKNEIDNYASYMGLNNLYNSLNNDMFSEYQVQKELNDRLEIIDEELKKVAEEKSALNKKYYEIIDKLVIKFGLNELEDSQYKAVDRVFCASGSNKPISTVIWYFTLNNLKKYYNANSLFLPMVLDSPKNAEMDDDKEKALIEFILEESPNHSQLIFSSIGFSPIEFDFDKNINIIELKNAKYQLLDEKSYDENKELLDMVVNLHLI